MNCPDCKTANDADALFCSSCGKPISQGSSTPPAGAKGRWYLIALLILPVIAISAVGYYKFFTPEGVAAVVNGEEITLSELDAAVARMGGGNQTSSVARHQALNELITERLVLQEAAKSGIGLSREEVARAAAEARASSGLDDAAFTREMTRLYGDMRHFEKALERRLIVHRLIAEKIVTPGSDQRTAAFALSRWLQGLSSRAVVRVKLAERLAGADCACCNKPESPGRGKNCAKKGSTTQSGQECAAAQAGLN